MEKKYSSLEIFENFYGKKDKLIRIVLTDHTVMEGMLAGIAEGEGSNITKWNFIAKEDISEYKKLPHDEAINEFGSVIRHEDIKEIRFK